MCKYCDDKSGRFQTFHSVYEKIGDGEKPPYVKVYMLTGGKDVATMRVESASENLVNRATFEIKYCPFCGADLEVEK